MGGRSQDPRTKVCLETLGRPSPLDSTQRGTGGVIDGGWGEGGGAESFQFRLVVPGSLSAS